MQGSYTGNGIANEHVSQSKFYFRHSVCIYLDPVVDHPVARLVIATGRATWRLVVPHVVQHHIT